MAKDVFTWTIGLGCAVFTSNTSLGLLMADPITTTSVVPHFSHGRFHLVQVLTRRQQLGGLDETGQDGKKAPKAKAKAKAKAKLTGKAKNKNQSKKSKNGQSSPEAGVAGGSGPASSSAPAASSATG